MIAVEARVHGTHAFESLHKQHCPNQDHSAEGNLRGDDQVPWQPSPSRGTAGSQSAHEFRPRALQGRRQRKQYHCRQRNQERESEHTKVDVDVHR